jgi:hypothetical protein
MIRGIGPVYAKKLLRAFGDEVFDVIDAEPDRLREVDGIGPHVPPRELAWVYFTLGWGWGTVRALSSRARLMLEEPANSF